MQLFKISYMLRDEPSDIGDVKVLADSRKLAEAFVRRNIKKPIRIETCEMISDGILAIDDAIIERILLQSKEYNNENQ